MKIRASPKYPASYCILKDIRERPLLPVDSQTPPERLLRAQPKFSMQGGVAPSKNANFWFPEMIPSNISINYTPPTHTLHPEASTKGAL